MARTRSLYTLVIVLIVTALTPLTAGAVAAQDATLVADISPGPDWTQTIDQLTDVDGMLFFTASNPGSLGSEVWVSDGTSGGTSMVKDIAPGALASSAPTELERFDGALWFVANDGSGSAIWRSDGTEAGTEKILDGFTSAPTKLTAADSALYFVTSVGTTGLELFRFNGTSMELVKNIAPPDGVSSSPANLTMVEDTLFFSADDGTNGRELWTSDGSSDGTVMVEDLTPAGSTTFFAPAAVDGRLYWGGGSSVYVSDGTPDGTIVLKTIPASMLANTFTAFGDAVYFCGRDATFSSRLWRTDGTPDGTSIVTTEYEVVTATDCGLRSIGDELIFFASHFTTGYEPHVSDGTAAGTHIVRELASAPSESSLSSPWPVVAVGDTYYFGGQDDSNGEELWYSDGTSAGTKMVDLRPGAGDGAPTAIAASGGQIFFDPTTAEAGHELYKLIPRTVSVATTVATEGDSEYVTFTISLSQAADEAVSVDFTTENGTARAGRDYAGTSGSLTFPPGQTEKQITIAMYDDDVYEFDETFGLRLTNPYSVQLAGSYAAATILEDDDAPSVSIADASRREGKKGTTPPLTFALTLSGPADRPLAVDVTASDGTAIAPTDYTFAPTTVTFNANQTAKSVTATLIGDKKREKNETFTVSLASSQAQIDDGSAVGTILNDDA